MGINYNLAVDRLEGLYLYFYGFLRAASGSAEGVKGAKGFTTAKMCSLLFRPSQSSGRGCHRKGSRFPVLPWHGRMWPRHCRSSLPFLLSAWQLPLLSPLPWQCQPGSHGVSACASTRQARSHAGLEPRSRHSPPS